MKLLVCGSRHMTDHALVERTLRYYAADSDLRVITGTRLDEDRYIADAPQVGTDRIVHAWCVRHDVPCEVFEADWQHFKRRAGPIRNAQMVAEKPDTFLAFLLVGEKNAGTLDTMKQAVRAGLHGEALMVGPGDQVQMFLVEKRYDVTALESRLAGVPATLSGDHVVEAHEGAAL